MTYQYLSEQRGTFVSDRVVGKGKGEEGSVHPEGRCEVVHSLISHLVATEVQEHESSVL